MEGPKPPKEFSWFKSFAPQFEALVFIYLCAQGFTSYLQTTKNFHTLTKRKAGVGCILLTPLVFILLFWVLKASINPLAENHKSKDVSLDLTKINPCQVVDSSYSPIPHANCTLLIYSPRNETTDAIMRSFSSSNSLRFGRDVLGLDQPEEIGKWVFNNLGQSNFFVYFRERDAYSSENEIHYSFFYNETSTTLDRWEGGVDFNRAGQVLAIQRALDQAIVEFKLGRKIQLDLSMQPVTILDPIQEKVNANVLIPITCGLFIVMGGLITAMVFMQLIASEKRRKLLGMLRMQGLIESTYWVSWYVFVPILAAISASFLILGGRLSDTNVFTNCNFFVELLLITAFLSCATAQMFFIISFTQRPRWVNLLGFALLGTATLMQYIFALIDVVQIELSGGTSSSGSGSSSKGPAYMSFWNSKYSDSTSSFTKVLMWIFPWFHFGKGFSDIMGVTKFKGMPGEGKSFTWGDFTDDYGPFKDPDNSKLTFMAPSTAAAVLNLILLCVVYLVLTWYFAQIAGSRASKKPWFFLLPEFWGFTKPEEHMMEGDTMAALTHESFAEQSIKIHKLTKTFTGCTAVKEMSLTMKPNQIFCLLGHNGAGKTTTINVLTGLESPTHGQAYVCGLSVRGEMPLIQQMMGVCPQHDILFENLSGREHLRFWGKFKGMKKDDLERTVTTVLDAVTLTQDADVVASKYSGGMMRRLSVGIATMGHPKVLFLDEPTTGMDPLSKRRVWDMIRELKQDGRIIVLTTHSLEEADILGDEIAIMSIGRLRAIGSSLFLKDRYGSGHHVSLLTAPQNAVAVEQLVQKALPGAEIIDSSAGNITVSLPHNATRRLPAFFRALESPDSVVNEWGVSNTTLEEVFLRLTAQNREVNQDLGRAEQKMCSLCGVQPTNRVTLYTAQGIAVMVDNVVCVGCAIASAEHKTDEGEDSSEAPVSFSLPSAPAISSKDVTLVANATTPNSVTLGYSPPSDGVQPIEDTFQVHTLSHSTKISTWVQFEGLAIKNFQLQARQKKTLWCTGILYCLLVLITVLVTPASHGTNSYIDSDGNRVCSNGLMFYQWDTQGINLCNATNFGDWFLTKLVSQSSNSLDTTSSMWVNNTYHSFAMPSDGPLNAYSNYGRGISAGGAVDIWSKRLWYHEDYSKYEYGKRAFTDWNLFGYPGQSSQYETFIYSKKNATLNSVLQNSQQWVKARLTDFPSSDTCKGMRGTNDGYSDKLVDGQAVIFGDSYDVWTNYSALFPDMAFDVLLSDVDLSSMAVKFWTPYNKVTYGDMWWVPADKGPGYSPCGILQWQDKDAGNMVTNYLASMIHHLSNSFFFTEEKWNRNTMLPNKTIRTEINTMPSLNYQSYDQTGIVLALLSITMISMLFLPTFLTFLVEERQNKLYNMLTMQGMKHSPYWCAAYVYYLAMATVGTMIYIFLNKLVGIMTFSTYGFFPMLGCVLLWGHCQAGMGFLLSAVFSKSRVTSVIAYILIILMVCTAPTFAMYLHNWPFGLLIFPPTGAIRMFSLLFSTSSQGSDFVEPLVALTLSGTLMVFLGIYLHLVLPSAVGRAKHPLFFLNCFQVKRRSPRSGSSHSSLPLLSSQSQTSFSQSKLVAEAAGNEDEDVAAERRRVFSTNPDDVAIRICNLCKTYGGNGDTAPKHAVKSVSLAIQYDEVFGLLGRKSSMEALLTVSANGAGKSTTLHMLTGTTTGTRGSAHVCGYEISAEMDAIHQHIGMCPQFDVVWDSLSTRQHLVLYAKIKGIPSKEIFAVVQRVAEQVELDGDALDTQASALSGGTRRRLSLAISLLCEPRVLFLDEPTTGLDAETRRSIWGIINRFKPGRCVVLCTHSMEEADTLSTRIGIMANGELRCVGSQLHLKNRFGEGYELKVSLEAPPDGNFSALDASLDDFIHQLCPAAKLVYRFDASRTYTLPKGSVEVSRVFEELENHRARIGVKVGLHACVGLMEGQEYGLSHTSLEEVFIRIAKEAEEAEAPDPEME